MSSFKFVIPAATTNLFTNPSFETNTTGWSSSSFTLAREFSITRIGGYSLKCTAAGTFPEVVGASVTLPTTNRRYFVSTWVYVPSTETFPTTAFDGGDLRWATIGFSGAATLSLTHVTEWIDGQSPRDVWFPLIAHIDIDTDVTGTFRVETDSAPGSGDLLFFDNFQLEQDILSTYCDGDQSGCTWTGTEHASTSTRSANTTPTEGGEIVDAFDGLGMAVEFMGGTGSPQFQNITRDRALTDGVEFLRTRIRGAQIRLVSRVSGSDMNNYHAKRRALLDVLKPDDDEGIETVVLQYWGAIETSGVKEINVRLAAGFELAKSTGFSERLPVVVESSDPYWRAPGEQSRSLSYIAYQINHGGIIARMNGTWASLGLTATSHTSFSEITAVVHDPRDNVVYVGGNFTGFNSGSLTGADHFVRYNLSTSSWERCGGANAVSSRVWGLALRPQGGVYLCGDFQNLGGANGDGVAYFDGSTFGALAATNSASNVREIGVGLDGDIFIVGPFIDFAGDTDADGVAYYDVSAGTWGDVIGSFSLQTYALGIAANGDLYIGGDWNTSADGITVHNILRAELPVPGTKRAMGDGLGSGTDVVESIFVDDNGDVYAGGALFGDPGQGVSRWNGSEWFALGSGTNGLVYQMARVLSDIIVSCATTSPTAGGLSLPSRVAAWDGSAWRPLDFYDSLTDWEAVANVNDEIWLGGDATSVGMNTANITTIKPIGTTAKMFPWFKIDVSFNNVNNTAKLISIINETTGAKLFFDYDFVDGESLFIDLRPGQRVMISSVFGPRWDILPSSDVANFWLRSGVDNDITCFINAGGTPEPDVLPRIGWTDQFWGID